MPSLHLVELVNGGAGSEGCSRSDAEFRTAEAISARHLKLLELPHRRRCLRRWGGALEFANMWPFGKGKPARFAGESAYNRNLANQLAMAPQTVAQLHEAGMKPGARLRLEYFFYAASRANGEALAHVLIGKGYSSECGPAADGSSLFCITGWTQPFSIDQGTAVAWTNDMCRLGFEHDCEFDGWGTNPHQPELEN